MRRLPRSFFRRDSRELAPLLLNKVLVHGDRSVRLVEVEAYAGSDDPGSHAYRGMRPKNATMFGPPGHLYVYFSYGVHYCLNVTADAPGVAGAVLLRALEPLAGMEVMRRRGDRGPEVRLLSGPGKIGRGFGLTLKDNGRDFTRGPLGLAAGTAVPDGQVAITRRIGISRAVDLPYRFSVMGSRSVSG